MSNLIAHRALDNNQYKENTIDSILDCVNKSYIKGIEIDVRITKDNKMVVIHDSTINRTSNGSGFVKNMTLKKLKKYNFGTIDRPNTISTLKEILKIIPKDKIILIEIKCINDEENYIKYFYNNIKSYLDKNIYVMSFNEKVIQILKYNYPSIKCGILISKIINNKYLDKNLDFIAISSYSINEVKNYNKPIFVWALNNKKRYKKLKKKMSKNTFYIVDKPKNYLY